MDHREILRHGAYWIGLKSATYVLCTAHNRKYLAKDLQGSESQLVPLMCDSGSALLLTLTKAVVIFGNKPKCCTL